MADSGHPPAELHERLLICRTIKLNAGALGGHRRCCHAQMRKNAQSKPQIARLILCVRTTLQVYCNLFLTFCRRVLPHFLIFYEKAIDKRTFSLLYCPLSCRAEYGGIAQLARAFGSYPKCPRFESRCRYQGDAAPAASHLRPVGQVVKTPPFHGGNMGSSPVRVTTFGGLAQLVRAHASHA